MVWMKKQPRKKHMRSYCLGYRNNLNISYGSSVMDETIESDPMHKKVMETRDAFINEEALGAANVKRKFLLKRLLTQYTFSRK